MTSLHSATRVLATFGELNIVLTMPLKNGGVICKERGGNPGSGQTIQDKETEHDGEESPESGVWSLIMMLIEGR